MCVGACVCDYLEVVLSTTWYDNEEGGKKNLTTSKSKTIQSWMWLKVGAITPKVIDIAQYHGVGLSLLKLWRPYISKEVSRQQQNKCQMISLLLGN